MSDVLSPRAEAITAMECLIDLGRQVRSARESRGLRYRDVAAETGISAGALHGIEHGSDPHVSTAMILLDWLASDPRR